MGPSYFVRGDGHIDAAYSAVRVAAAASAGMQAGHRYAKINGITQPTAEVVNVCAETAGRLVALRPGPLETKAALRIQALVRATMARNNTRRGKAAQLRFAKLSVFDFLQAMVDVWEEARLNTEEKLVSMFMLGDQNGDGALDYSEFEPLAREFAQLLGQVDVSEHRIRNMFMYMLQESSNDTGPSRWTCSCRQWLVRCTLRAAHAPSRALKWCASCRLCKRSQEGDGGQGECH